VAPGGKFVTKRQRFGRRGRDPAGATGLHGSRTLIQARRETEDFARELRLREQEESRTDIRTVVVAGVVLLVAGLLAVPMIGGGSSDTRTVVAGAEYDSMSPEELADLTPAAGQAEEMSLIERLLTLFR
jgi:hypothetical protein